MLGPAGETIGWAVGALLALRRATRTSHPGAGTQVSSIYRDCTHRDCTDCTPTDEQTWPRNRPPEGNQNRYKARSGA